jgi:hypothetical protein
MKINRQFNTFNLREYMDIIPNYKKYTDFNTLGLYRSIHETQKLSTEEKIVVRDYANTFFQKTYDFLQIKDPWTYVDLEILGLDLTRQQEHLVWEKVGVYQQIYLKEKKIKHRNFGMFSKHSCGYENCPYNGIMIKHGSVNTEVKMTFKTDKNTCNLGKKSKEAIKDRKNKNY